jgi:hypothetical protein
MITDDEARAKIMNPILVEACSEVDKLRNALELILELDKNHYLHRDPLDTDNVFKVARNAIRKNT